MENAKQARTALTLLFLGYALSITDRMILAVLFEPIRLEFGVSDTQMGFLGGLSFALFYATLGVPIARFADRSERRIIIVLSLAIFSMMTAFSGLATSFLGNL
jgi:predicted MFS family arabinose efflux permease